MGKIRAKREQAGFKKVSNYIMSFDFFGEPAKLKVKGRDTYPSCMGTLLTFGILATVLAYGVNKYNIMMNYGDTTY